MAGVVVFGEIRETGGGVDGDEVGPVECAREVLRYGTAEGRARVDADLQDVHGPGWGGGV